MEDNALGCVGSSNPYCVGKNDLLTTGGGGPVAGGVGAAGALATGGDKEGEGQTNVSKDLTDEQKKELGGTGSGTPGDWGPEDEEQGRDKNLSTSDQRSIKSLEEQIRLHEDKLEAYKKNPDSFDNKGYLQNASNEKVRQRIIDGRIRHLEQEIKTVHKNIDEIKSGKG